MSGARGLSFDVPAYQQLALAVIQHAIRDARAMSLTPEMAHREVVAFLTSPSAALWLQWLQLDPTRAAALFARKAAIR